jgi:hypothetical protein
MKILAMTIATIFMVSLPMEATAIINDPKGVPCLIVRESEIGFYDTVLVMVIWACRVDANRTYVMIKDGDDMWITSPKERLIKEKKK